MTTEQQRGIFATVRFWCQSPEFRRVARYIDSASAGHGDVEETIEEIQKQVGQVLRERAKTVELPISVVR